MQRATAYHRSGNEYSFWRVLTVDSWSCHRPLTVVGRALSPFAPLGTRWAISTRTSGMMNSVRKESGLACLTAFLKAQTTSGTLPEEVVSLSSGGEHDSGPFFLSYRNKSLRGQFKLRLVQPRGHFIGRIECYRSENSPGCKHFPMILSL